MLYREIIAVCSQIHTKHINTVWAERRIFRRVHKIAQSNWYFVMSVCLSVSAWNNSAPITQIFKTFGIWVFFFENVLRKFKFVWNLTRITGALHEDQFTLLIIPRSVLHSVRNVSDRSCRGNWNTHYMFNDVWKLCCLWDNVEKYCRDRQAINDDMAHVHCMLDT